MKIVQYNIIILLNILIYYYSTPSTQYAYISPEIHSRIEDIESKLDNIESEITNTQTDLYETMQENTLKSIHGIEVKKYELLGDFLLNNSKRITEVIENPALEINNKLHGDTSVDNDLSEFLFSHAGEDNVPKLHNPDTIGFIEEDNVQYQY